MSSINNNTNTLNADSIPDTTHHHFHPDSEPLPTHADRATDYSTEAIERGLPGATDSSHHHGQHHGTGHSQPHHDMNPTRDDMGGVSGMGKHEHRDNAGMGMGTGMGKHEHRDNSGMGTGIGKHEHRDSTSASSAAGAGSSAGIPGPGGQPAVHSKPGFGDKIIGKAQEVAGKMANNPTMQEKGELRRTEGKSGVAHQFDE